MKTAKAFLKSDKCPCDLCITRAICIGQRHETVLVKCEIIRQFLKIPEKGIISIPELRIFCNSLGFKLMESKTDGIGGTMYYIDQFGDRRIE